LAVWPYNTPQWRSLRLLKLRSSPDCECCAAFHRKRVPAVAVDHRVAIAAGGDPFPGMAGLRSLCASCHNSKTSRIDRPDRRTSSRPIKGHDANGNPTFDPDW
jgi:5-methylcytosine-specific restriction enzyme A